MYHAARFSSGYYGWRIVAALAVTETISWGIVYYAFSVLLAPMQRELGWTRAELTGGFSLGLLVAGAMAFPVGAWLDRHGPRLLMTCGSVLASLVIALWSQVSSLPAYYLLWVGLGVAAAMVLYEPAFTVLAQWFDRRRSSALAWVTFAAGLASTIFLPLTDGLVSVLGWRHALLVLGALLAVSTIPLHALVLRGRPTEVAMQAAGELDGRERPGTPAGSALRSALSSAAFWLLLGTFALASLAASGVRVHLVALLIDGGSLPGVAAAVAGSLGIWQVAGRVAFVPAERRFGDRWLLPCLLGLQALAMAMLLVQASLPWAGVFAVLFGAGVGMSTLMRPAILGRWYGAANYGRISSVLAMGLTVTGVVAPFGAGVLYDIGGSYAPVLWIAVALASASVVAALVLARVTARTV